MRVFVLSLLAAAVVAVIALEVCMELTGVSCETAEDEEPLFIGA